MLKLWLQGPRFENPCRRVFPQWMEGMGWGQSCGSPTFTIWPPRLVGENLQSVLLLCLFSPDWEPFGAQTSALMAEESLSQCWVFFNEFGLNVSLLISKRVVGCFLGFEEEGGLKPGPCAPLQPDLFVRSLPTGRRHSVTPHQGGV